MRLTESINRNMINESGDSLFRKILDVIEDNNIQDDVLAVAIGDDSIMVRHKDNNKEVWVQFDDTVEVIKEKLLTLFEEVKEGEELEEASLWDSLPDDFKGKIAGASELVKRIQGIQGVQAQAEVNGNEMVIVLTGDLLKAMDAVDVLGAAAKQQNLEINTNYGEKKFTITIKN